MPTAFADETAALTAGYKVIKLDRGAGKSPRYVCRFEKPSTGTSGSSGALIVAEATSDAGQITADANALAALNNQRNHRYGFAAAGGSVGNHGEAQTVDVS